MRDILIFLAAAAAIAVVAVVAAPLGQKPPDIPVPVRDIAPEAARANLTANPRIVLLDVRTPEEYAERHIPGSLLVPLAPAAEFVPALAEAVPDRRSVIYVYCRSGRRSLEAAAIIRDAGYPNAYNLGGIIDWPYETSQDKDEAAQRARSSR